MHRLLRQILHHVPAYLVAILLAAAGVQGARAAPELHGKHFLALEEAALVVPVGSDGGLRPRG
jgi:hypothetical protein